VRLSLGCIKNKKIKCALHGYSFNLETGWSSDEDLERLKIYQVKREKAGIFIEMEDN
jgi:nitrite reductase/ring-hydroxylating ferredoxin subunit